MKHMLSRAALTMAVLSALGTASVGAVDAGPTIPEVKNAVTVVKAPTADESSKTGWLAELLLVIPYSIGKLLVKMMVLCHKIQKII